MELRLAPCERDCLQDILDMTISGLAMECRTIPGFITRLSVLETQLVSSSLLLLQESDVFLLLDAVQLYTELPKLCDDEEKSSLREICVGSIHTKLLRLYEFEHFKRERGNRLMG